MAPQRGDVQARRRGARARRDGPGTVEHDLTDVIDVLWRIEERTQPVDRVISAANLDLTAAHVALRDGLADLAGEPTAPPR